MRYTGYSEYGDPISATGVSFPKHWRIERLRFSIQSNPVKSEIKDKNPDKLVTFIPMEAVGEYGGINTTQEKLLGDVYSGYTYFAENDILVAKITPCFENGKGAIANGLKNRIGFGTTELHVLRPLEGITVRWLFYLTLSSWFRLMGTSEMQGAGGQKRVPENFIRDFQTGIPPLYEQERIADFLDYKTAQIDALIGKRRELIEKLKEQHAVVIAQAVTKGIETTVPMRYSGVAWLGKVPKHWEVMQLRRRFDIHDCKHKTVSFVNDGIPLASIREVHDFEVNLSRANKTTEEEYLHMIEGGRKPQLGDIIYSRNATVGDAAIVSTSERFCMGQDVCLIRSPEQFPRFVAYLLRSYPLREQAEALMVGSTFKRINVGQIKAFWIALPPVEEQIAIANFLDNQTKRIELMINKVESAIDRLMEYRTALITAATTGKIDVRNVQVGKQCSSAGQSQINDDASRQVDRVTLCSFENANIETAY